MVIGSFTYAYQMIYLHYKSCKNLINLFKEKFIPLLKINSFFLVFKTNEIKRLLPFYNQKM